ncbi:carbon-nitrogen hydrolase family protein [Parapedobacter deserti]|uniref:Carbon-nitrogen hydrolase family protein n=1 Tax=Parapedobacter deserti TaxID=1912957 RepID=A0ABV7JNI1_9SPHI
MRIALASPPICPDNAQRLAWLGQLTEAAKMTGASVVCFPESFLPGYRGMGYAESERTPEALEKALAEAQSIAARHHIAIILPMDWYIDGSVYNVAQVIAADGKVLGHQAKVQLDPSEDDWWNPGYTRHIFEADGLVFGIAICHEGFRYPETVRWAARQGAKVVFHPHFSGGNEAGVTLREWGHKDNPYYEKAMQMRALENTIYFASVNYATTYQESGSAIIAPDGTCLVHQQYGEPGITVTDINLGKATGFLANRFKPIG